jgi:hypothetical protein
VWIRRTVKSAGPGQVNFRNCMAHSTCLVMAWPQLHWPGHCHPTVLSTLRCSTVWATPIHTVQVGVLLTHTSGSQGPQLRQFRILSSARIRTRTQDKPALIHTCPSHRASPREKRSLRKAVQRSRQRGQLRSAGLTCLHTLLGAQQQRHCCC